LSTKYFISFLTIFYNVLSISGFPLSSNTSCDSVPTRTSIRALGLLFRMDTTELFCDTGMQKLFCRVVQPNVNVRRVDVPLMTDKKHVASLTNAIMMDATAASETIPNLDAKFSFHPYKFCADGSGNDKAQLFSCMGVSCDGTYRLYVPVPLYTGQMTEEDIMHFMALFNINGNVDGAIQALHLFLQKYSTLTDRVDWESLVDGV
jgi:hypothetical protein